MPILEDKSICPVAIYDSYLKAIQARAIPIVPERNFWVQCYDDRYFTNQNLGMLLNLLNYHFYLINFNRHSKIRRLWKINCKNFESAKS